MHFWRSPFIAFAVTATIGELRAVGDLAFLTDEVTETLEFLARTFVEIDHVVEGFSDFAVDT